MRLYFEKDACIPQWLEKSLTTFEKIILFVSPALLQAFCNSKATKNTSCHILLLTSEKTGVHSKYQNIRYITKEEEKDLCRLYATYEFTDQFYIISEYDKGFGSLLSLMNREILNQEEYFQAMLAR